MGPAGINWIEFFSGRISLMQEKRVRTWLVVVGEDARKLGQVSLFYLWISPTNTCLPLNDAQSLDLHLVPAHHHKGLVLVSITSHILTPRAQETCGSTISAQAISHCHGWVPPRAEPAPAPATTAWLRAKGSVSMGLPAVVYMCSSEVRKEKKKKKRKKKEKRKE